MLRHTLIKSAVLLSAIFGSHTHATTLETSEGTLQVQRAFSMHTNGRKYSHNRSSLNLQPGSHRVKLEILSTAADGSFRPFFLGHDNDRGRVFEFTVGAGPSAQSVRILVPEFVDSIPWQSSGQTFNMKISRSQVDRREPNRVIQQECEVKVSCYRGGWRSSGCTYATGKQSVLAYDDVTVYSMKVRMTDRASNQVIGDFSGQSNYRRTNVVREIGECKLNLNR